MFDIKAIMASYGFHIIGEVNYNTENCQRFRSVHKPHGEKDLFLFLHGDRGATFGDWHDPSNWPTWWNKSNKLTINDLKDRIEYLEEVKIRKNEMRLIAIERAFNFWEANYVSHYIDQNPYALKKRINTYYARGINHYRYIRDILLIPIADIDMQFKSVQIIKANGFKRLWKGTSQKGNMIWLSEKLENDYSGSIRICEGYATGCSIYEAIGGPVVCAINASNLVNVAVQLRAKFVNAKLKICADNDQWGKENVGLKYGKEALMRTGATLHYPDFSGVDISTQPTDFNDLMCLTNIEAVENQLILIRK